MQTHVREAHDEAKTSLQPTAQSILQLGGEGSQWIHLRLAAWTQIWYSPGTCSWVKASCRGKVCGSWICPWLAYHANNGNKVGGRALWPAALYQAGIPKSTFSYPRRPCAAENDWIQLRRSAKPRAPHQLSLARSNFIVYPQPAFFDAILLPRCIIHRPRVFLVRTLALGIFYAELFHENW